MIEGLDAQADETFLLDLLNSRPIVDGVERDELATTRSGLDWLAAHDLRATGPELRAARHARDLLRDTVHGESPASAVATLLADVRLRPVSSDAGVAWRVDAGHADRVSVRAALAWGTVLHDAPGRLRPCGNAECQLFLVDHSRAGTARWCSMAGCGNRMKARRHHARAREQ